MLQESILLRFTQNDSLHLGRHVAHLGHEQNVPPYTAGIDTLAQGPAAAVSTTLSDGFKSRQ